MISPPTERRAILLELDLRVYRMSAIKKAAYKFGDRCFVEIAQVSDNVIQATLQSKLVATDLDQLRGHFQNEVLDQELREVVAQETAEVRNLLLAQAFSQTSLVDPLGESADYLEDPLQIRPPDPTHMP